MTTCPCGKPATTKVTDHATKTLVSFHCGDVTHATPPHVVDTDDVDPRTTFRVVYLDRARAGEFDLLIARNFGRAS